MPTAWKSATGDASISADPGRSKGMKESIDSAIGEHRLESSFWGEKMKTDGIVIAKLLTTDCLTSFLFFEKFALYL